MWGALGGPLGVRRGQGGPGVDWLEGSRGGSRWYQRGFWVVLGVLGKGMLPWGEGEFVNCQMKHLCFQFCVVSRSGQWSLDHVAFHCFSKHILVRCSQVNMLWKPWFLNTSNIAFSDFNEKRCRKHDFGWWILMSRSINFSGNPGCFFNSFFLHFVRFLKEHMNMMLLEESAKVNTTLDVDQQMRFVWMIWWIKRAE